MDVKRISTAHRRVTARLGPMRGPEPLRITMLDGTGRPIARQGRLDVRVEADGSLVVCHLAPASPAATYIVDRLVGAGFLTSSKPKMRPRIEPPSGVSSEARPAGAVLRRPEQPRTAERSAVTDFDAEASRLRLPLGPAPTDAEARHRLEVVAADAKDIFPDPAAAMVFLTTRPLDAKGRTGIEVLRQKGLPGVLSRLDNLRFGYSG